MNYPINTFIKISTALACFIYSAVIFSESSSDISAKYFGTANFMMGMSAMLDAMQVIISAPRRIILVQSFSYISLEVAVCSLFLFSLYFSKVKYKKTLFSYLYLFPIIFSILTAGFYIFSKNDFFLQVSSEEQIRTAFMPGYFYPKRIPYYIHATYTFGTAVSLSVIFSVRGIKNFSENKHIFLMFFIGMSVYFITGTHKFIIENFTVRNYIPIQEYFNSFFQFCMLTTAFLAVYSDDNQRCISKARQVLYEISSQPVIIFNSKNRFLQMNDRAADFFDIHGVHIRKFEPFAEIFAENSFQILGMTDLSNPMKEFYLSGVEDKKLYYVQMSAVFDGKKHLGSVMRLLNMNFYDGVVKTLEQAAYTDELTGVRKKDAFVKYATNLINKSMEPLLLLCFSIDGLENLNERLGIRTADTYIKKFTDIICASMQNILFPDSKENLYELFRIYGSTFAVILPESREENLSDLIKDIKQNCSAPAETKDEVISFSFGYSIMENKSHNAWEFFQESYKNLLLNKKNKQLI